MINKYYERIKAHYESVKPIRGKLASENIRPMASRIRKWERVVEDVRIINGEEETWYGYRLHDTDVMMASPTGIVEFKTGGWDTVTTSKFIDLVTRNMFWGNVRCSKRDNELWIHTESKKYPILGKAIFVFVDTTSETTLIPVAPIKRDEPLVNRKVMKEVMKPYKPMIDYINSIVVLSGGLLSRELRKSLSCEELEESKWGDRMDYKFSTGHILPEFTPADYKYHAKSILKVAKQGTQEDWLKLLCALRGTLSYTSENVGEVTYKYTAFYGKESEITKSIFDYRITLKQHTIRNMIARLVKDVHQEVWTTKEVTYD